MNIIDKIGDIQDCINKFPNKEIIGMLEDLKEDLILKKIHNIPIVVIYCMYFFGNLKT